MSSRKSPSKTLWGAVVTVILVLAIGSVVVFQTDMLGLKGDDYDSALLPSVRLSGTIKAKDLNLTGMEITSLNNLSRSYGDLFSTMDMNLILENKYAPIVVEHDTVMLLKLTCTTHDAEVVFRQREVRRSDLVKHMQKTMKVAETEFKRHRDMNGGNVFRRLEI